MSSPRQRKPGQTPGGAVTPSRRAVAEYVRAEKEMRAAQRAMRFWNLEFELAWNAFEKARLALGDRGGPGSSRTEQERVSLSEIDDEGASSLLTRMSALHEEYSSLGMKEDLATLQAQVLIDMGLSSSRVSRLLERQGARISPDGVRQRLLRAKARGGALWRLFSRRAQVDLFNRFVASSARTRRTSAHGKGQP